MFERFPDDLEYKVVINHEEQYSIWPADRHAPEGWKDVGGDVTGFAVTGPQTFGSKMDCINYIEEVWTDMRPLLVHDEMAQLLRRSG